MLWTVVAGVVLLLVACDLQVEPQPSDATRTLCDALENTDSATGRQQRVADFILDHPDFAGGAFDAPTLTGLVNRSLSGDTITQDDAVTDKQRLKECSEFLLSHWLIGNAGGN